MKGRIRGGKESLVVTGRVKENQSAPKDMDWKKEREHKKQGEDEGRGVGGNVEETGWETINTAHQDAASSD